MKCPKCGGVSRQTLVGTDPPFDSVVECMACKRSVPYLPPAVKRAFTACKRALALWQKAVWVGSERRSALAKVGDKAARGAIARAEQGEAK